jgi:hypothetical protein
MILSERHWEYKSLVTVLLVKPKKTIQNIVATIKNNSCLLTSTLSAQKTIVVIAALLIFQFSLYDFNLGEYTNYP